MCDELDRTKEIQYNTGEGGTFETKYAYTYTAAGQLYSVTDYVSEETHLFTYDTQGKKIRSYLVDNTTNEVAYRDIVLYDAQERVSQFTQLFAFANAGVETVTSNYTYNTDGEMDHYTQTSTDLAVETNYYYDDLGRATRRKIAFSSGGIGRHAQVNHYTFTTGNGNTSMQVSSVLTEVFYGTDTSTPDGLLTSTTYNLTYDANGNITKIANALGVAQHQYAYDSMGQLTREDNRALNATYVYTYDNAGNILSKTEYAYTEGSLDGVTPTSTTDYTYGNPNWGDLLTSVGGTNLTYDAIGNIVGIGNTTLTWQGRELLSYGTTTYTYNADGIRTSKTVNGVKHTYVLYGSKVISETWGDNVLLYIYDELNTPVGLKYRNSTYADGVYDCFFFEKNFLGDIVAIYDENGVKLGTYTYDAWGNFTVTATNATAGTLAYNILYNYNPFRYRGYYYDVETGLYYLQSRYYNAEWGRFISADGVISGVGGAVLGYNQYAYCFNDPVNMTDANGNWPSWKEIKKRAKEIKEKIQDKAHDVLRSLSDGWNDVKQLACTDKINNTDPNVVKNDTFVSGYKGNLVVVTPFDASFSFGVIGLSNQQKDEDSLNHEYGHTIQMEHMGVTEYIKEVAVPSLTINVLDRIGKLPYDYFSYPWEAEANELGGSTLTQGRQQMPENAYKSYLDIIVLFFK